MKRQKTFRFFDTEAAARAFEKTLPRRQGVPRLQNRPRRA